MSVTPAPDPTSGLGEAAALTGIVVTPGTQDGVHQSNRDAHGVITRLAAQMVRRKCNQHQCEGAACAHPNHRRDVDFLRHCLEVLGLPGDHQEVTPEDRDNLMSSLSHQPTEGMLSVAEDDD